MTADLVSTQMGNPRPQPFISLAQHRQGIAFTSALDAALRAAKKDEGILWHTVQFFVVGEIMKRPLAADGVAFSSYLYETGPFDRAWANTDPR